MGERDEYKDEGVSGVLDRTRNRGSGSGGGSGPKPPTPESAKKTPGGGGSAPTGPTPKGPTADSVPTVDEVEGENLRQTKTADGVSLAYDDEIQEMPDELDPGEDPESQRANQELSFQDEAQEIQSEEDLMSLIPNEQEQNQGQVQTGQAQTQPSGGNPNNPGPNPPTPDSLPEEYQQGGQQSSGSQIVTTESDQTRRTREKQSGRTQTTTQQESGRNSPSEPAQQVIQLCREFTQKIRNIRLSTSDREVLREKLEFIGDDVGDNVLEAVIEELDL